MALSSSPLPRSNPACTAGTALSIVDTSPISSTRAGSTGPHSWAHPPSTRSNRIRSASWCATNPASAVSSAAASTSSASSTITDWSNRSGDADESNHQR